MRYRSSAAAAFRASFISLDNSVTNFAFKFCDYEIKGVYPLFAVGAGAGRLAFSSNKRFYYVLLLSVYA